jgi:ABC-type branched-subunit amino acid transport system substrate-binding protein
MQGRELACHAVIVALLLPIVAAAAVRAQTTTTVPYASISTEVESYAGPGRASANDLKGQVVRIGLLAPLQGARKAEGDAMVAAAQMALRDSASQRLNRGRRVALAVEDSSGGSWGVVSDAVIRLMLDDEAVAVITSTSGADTHLCEQVGNRIGVPVLTLSADSTTTQIDIPWIFRMGPSDVEKADVIAQDRAGEVDEPTAKRREFVTRFRRATGVTPGRVASETYDAVVLTVQALQKTGPNSARIRDELGKTVNYDGMSGKIMFDREGNNRASLHPVQGK